MQTRNFIKSVFTWGGGMALVVVLAACGGPAATVTPTDTPTIEPADHTEAEGQQLFVSKGCAACHGDDAEGSAIAPALPGHTADQVRRQVRNPIGNMPRFSQEQLTDEELEEIVEYLTGLEGGDGHLEPSSLPSDDLSQMHHWMALLSLQHNNVPEARHHVGHIVDIVEDKEHQRSMEQVLTDLDAGNLHDAEHAIQEMLTGMAEPQLTLEELHLQMALAALSAEDGPDAQHHLEHYIEEDTAPAEAQEALSHIMAGERHEAEEVITQILEGMPHQHHRHE